MRHRYAGKRAAAVLLVVLLCAESMIAQASLPEEARSAVNTAIQLAQTDVEANRESIKLMLEQCVSMLQEDDPALSTLQNVLILMDSEEPSAEAVTALLQGLVDDQSQETEEGTEATGSGESGTSAVLPEGVPSSDLIWGDESELPSYEVNTYVTKVLQDSVLVDVPEDWGNNDTGSTITSYSPVNGSGAISPSAGTLTVSYYEYTETTEQEALEAYQESIAKMSVTAYLEGDDVTTAQLPARCMDYIMLVGANQFMCEAICFAYNQSIYSIQLMQGMQATYDYLPILHEVAASTQVGDAESIAQTRDEAEEPNTEAPTTEQAVIEEPSTKTPATEAPMTEEPSTGVPYTEAPVNEEPSTEAPDTEAAVTETPVTEAVPTDGPSTETPHTEAPETEVPATDAAAVDSTGLPDDMGTFCYQLNGQTCQFPTAVSDLDDSVLPLRKTIELPYEFHSDEDMVQGNWTEIVNTQYCYFENARYKEMIGITNMSGQVVPLSEGIVTALIDTQGTTLEITLPGNVKVGDPESAILEGFPEFAAVTMDGTAQFRGNELLYAANVRDDGCNGYVLIRNDAPYYSAVSIICENGVIKEISFECLGSVRAEGVFL